MPRGFEEEEGKVPRLERLLNGLHQFPRNFLENLKTNLLKWDSLFICRSMSLHLRNSNLFSLCWWYIVIQSYTNRNLEDIEMIGRNINGAFVEDDVVGFPGVRDSINTNRVYTDRYNKENYRSNGHWRRKHKGNTFETELLPVNKLEILQNHHFTMQALSGCCNTCKHLR